MNILFNNDISDHLPVFIIRENVSTQSSPHYHSVFKSYRNTNAANVDKLYEVLSYLLSIFSFPQHHNVLFGNLFDFIFKTYCECCHIKDKQLSSKQVISIWINNELKSRNKLSLSYYL